MGLNIKKEKINKIQKIIITIKINSLMIITITKKNSHMTNNLKISHYLRRTWNEMDKMVHR